MLAGIRTWVRGLGLWPRVAFAISVGFLGLFTAFSVLGELALREGSDRLLEERLVIAQMAAAQIDLTLEEALSELEQARRFADFDPQGQDLSQEIHVLAHTYGRVGMFDPGISFLDSNGVVVLSEPVRLYPPGTDLSGLPHIANALASEQSTISEGFLSPTTEQPVVAITVPIVEDGQTIGLLSGLLDLRGALITEPLERAARLGRTGHAVLVNAESGALASTFHLPFLAPGEHISFYRLATEREEPVIETVSLESIPGSDDSDIEHVMAFAILTNAPWGVAVGGDSDETFAAVQRLRYGLAVLGVGALLSIWTATLLGTRRLVRPVQRLTQAAERIAGRELETPLKVTEGGEIGVMAEALERMRRLLLANIEELANWNEKLEERVVERTRELHHQQDLVRRLLRRTINAHEEERARLALELHDDIGQMLTAVQLSIDHLANIVPEDGFRYQEHLLRTRDLTNVAMRDLRRIIAAVRPGILSELGLVPALEWIADRTLGPMDISIGIESGPENVRMPDEIETLLFRIAQEAISNVARHSDASSLNIEVQATAGKVTMTVEDDGVGFDPASVSPGRDLEGGLGLAGMVERAALLGGTVEVESSPGRGSSIIVETPLPWDEQRPDE